MPESLIILKSKIQSLYKSLGAIYCPYFKEEIIFNAKDLEHLSFTKKNHARTQHDQYIRMHLFSYVPEIITKSHTLQGISYQKVFESIRSNGNSQYILKEVTYFEFIAVITHLDGKIRVRVIVKQIEDGPKYYWSVIPFWKSGKRRGERMMYSLPPEID